MTDFIYDTVRLEDMDAFIKHSKDISKAFHEQYREYLDYEDYYKMLCRYGLKENDIDPETRDRKNISSFFDRWMSDFRSDDRMHVFIDPKFDIFCQFKSVERVPNYDFIKLYIPIDYDHIERGVEELFQFVDSLNTPHISKVARSIRSDNITVRLHKKEIDSVEKIINFVNENEYIRSGLNPTNPFVPCVKGVGVILESGFSYNSCIAREINAYVNEAIEKDIDVSLEGFTSWLMHNAYNYVAPEEAKNMLDIYCALLNSSSKELSEQYIEDVPVYNDELQKQKIAVLLDAVKFKYNSSGPRGVVHALDKACRYGDYEAFNGNPNDLINYCDLLSDKVTRSDIIYFINTTLMLSGNTLQADYMANAEAYVGVLFANDLALKFDEICEATVDKYNAFQLDTAIKKYIMNKDPKGFPDFVGDNVETNYRNRLVTFFPEPGMVVSSIETSLHNRGIDTGMMTVPDMITTYSSTMEKERYTSAENTPKLK